jgi:predicted DNA-binding protein (UPF0251 family)
MPRPRKCRRIRFNPHVLYFKPRGIRLHRLKEIVLRHDEVEALRLKHEEGFDQIKAAKLMHISQSTFQRVLNSAHKKIAQAIIRGKAIRIEKTR